MPDLFRSISSYFWAIALAFSAFNYWKAGQSRVGVVAPEKELEAVRYLRIFAVAGALPWVIMGLGHLAGSTPTVWAYFRPQDGNVFVLAWLTAVFALSCAFAWWVFGANGAKKVVEYNLMAVLGQSVSKPPSEKMVKFYAVLGVATFPIWVYGVVSMNAPLPR